MRTVKGLLTVPLILFAGFPLVAQRAALPKSPRLYVFDCGRLEGGDVSRFRLTRQEMATTDMSVACYLVAHPRGTLIWDAGAVPDAGRRRGEALPDCAAEQRGAVRDVGTDAQVAAGGRRLRSC